MPNASVIPIIDLGPYLAGEPGALDRVRHALTEIGFYSIVNHGVPSALVHEVYRQVARFHAQPLDEKLKIKLDKHNVGYLQMMGDTLRTSVVANVTKPNMNEACAIWACGIGLSAPDPGNEPILARAAIHPAEKR